MSREEQSQLCALLTKLRFELSNQLYVRNIELSDFLVKVKETFDKADEIFKEEE